MNKLNNKNLNKKLQKQENKSTIPRQLALGKVKIRGDLTKTLWLNSATNLYSLSNATTLKYINFIQELVANSSIMSKYETLSLNSQTVYIFEYIKVKSLSIKWVPIGINKQISIALPGFSIRVFPCYMDNGLLPTNIAGNYIPTNYDIQINNIDKQTVYNVPLTNTINLSTYNAPTLFNTFTGSEFRTKGYVGTIGGMMLLNQTTPADTSDATYKLGHFEIDYHIVGYNLCA